MKGNCCSNDGIHNDNINSKDDNTTNNNNKLITVKPHEVLEDCNDSRGMNGLAVIVVYCPDENVFQQIQASNDIGIFRRSSSSNDNVENDTSNNNTNSELNQNEKNDEKEKKDATLEAMVHIVSRSLFQTSKYQDWIASFGENVSHIVIHHPMEDEEEKVEVEEHCKEEQEVVEVKELVEEGNMDTIQKDEIMEEVDKTNEDNIEEELIEVDDNNDNYNNNNNNHNEGRHLDVTPFKSAALGALARSLVCPEIYHNPFPRNNNNTIDVDQNGNKGIGNETGDDNKTADVSSSSASFLLLPSSSSSTSLSLFFICILIFFLRIVIFSKAPELSTD